MIIADGGGGTNDQVCLMSIRNVLFGAGSGLLISAAILVLVDIGRSVFSRDSSSSSEAITLTGFSDSDLAVPPRIADADATAVTRALPVPVSQGGAQQVDQATPRTATLATIDGVAEQVRALPAPSAPVEKAGLASDISKIVPTSGTSASLQSQSDSLSLTRALPEAGVKAAAPSLPSDLVPADKVDLVQTEPAALAEPEHLASDQRVALLTRSIRKWSPASVAGSSEIQATPSVQAPVQQATVLASSPLLSLSRQAASPNKVVSANFGALPLLTGTELILDQPEAQEELDNTELPVLIITRRAPPRPNRVGSTPSFAFAGHAPDQPVQGVVIMSEPKAARTRNTFNRIFRAQSNVARAPRRVAAGQADVQNPWKRGVYR